MPTNETVVESGRIGVVQLISSVSEVETFRLICNLTVGGCWKRKKLQSIEEQFNTDWGNLGLKLVKWSKSDLNHEGSAASVIRKVFNFLRPGFARGRRIL